MSGVGQQTILDRQMKLIILLIFLASCSDFEHRYQVDDNISIYVEKFYNEAAKRGKVYQKDNLIVRSSTSIGAKQGLCSRVNGQIIIDINYYSIIDMQTDYVEDIVLHELGHGLLNRSHDDSKPTIMNSYSCLQCYSENKEFYLDELFK